MKRCSFTKVLAALAAMLALAIPGLAAQDVPIFRADDAPADRMADNPGLLGLDDFDWAMGASLSLGSQTWEEVFRYGLSQGLDMSAFAYTQFLNYRIHRGMDGRVDHQVGLSMGIDRIFGLGYRQNFDQNNFITNNVMGLIFRPADFVSIGATMEHILENTMNAGFGLALRPLAFLPDGAPYLTLTADAQVSQTGFAMESAGASISAGGMELRGWYDFQKSSPGAQLTWRVGPTEAAVRHSDFNYSSGTTLIAAVRGGAPRTPSIILSSGRILVLEKLGVIPSSPHPLSWFQQFMGQGQPLDLIVLIKALERAADDPTISAVEIKEMPGFDDYAAAARFGAALEQLKAKGKAVYVYITDIGGWSYVASLGASSISLNPTGQIFLTSSGSQSLFVKQFLAQFGIRLVNLGSHDTKSAYNNLTMDSMPEGERQMRLRYYQALDQFTAQSLERNRSKIITTPADQILAKGPWLSAAAAKSDGLVDALEYSDEFDKRVSDAQPGREQVNFGQYLIENVKGSSWGNSLLSNKVAVVYLNGDIEGSDEEPGQKIGNKALQLLKDLAGMADIKGVILRVNTGGGTIVHSDNLDHQVQLLKKAGKKVVVSMADRAASGGYYLSAHADRIFAEATTLTGSIGVTGLMIDVSEAAKLLKVKVETVQTSPSASFGSMLDLKDQDVARMEGMIKEYYQRFLSVVSDGRGIPVETLEPLARGQIWTGAQALDLKLVDQIGGLKDAQDWMKAALGSNWVEFGDYIPGVGPALQGMPLPPMATAKATAGSLLPAFTQEPEQLKARISQSIQAAGTHLLDSLGSRHPQIDRLTMQVMDTLDSFLAMNGQILYRADL